MIQITRDHFSLDQIYASGQCFRMRLLSEGLYEIIAGHKYLLVSQKGNTIRFHCSDEEYPFWEEYFDLKTDYGSFIVAANPNDRYLMQAVRCAGGVRILKQDLWEMIVSFLVSQQNHIKRIRRCIEMLCERYGDYREIPKSMIPEDKENEGDKTAGDINYIPVKGYYAFPGPEAFAGLSEDALMECNLGYRSKYVVRTAGQIVSGEISLAKIRNLPYKEAKQELLKLFGVGEKVADCICLFSRHDLDAFPVDTHIRQALDRHYKRGFPNRRYRGFRGVIQQYIFYYELNGGDEKD